MSKDRTYASDVETKSDPAELAKRRSVDAEEAAKPGSSKERNEEHRAAGLANAAGQTGQNMCSTALRPL
jgi:hypothetical protein